MTGLYIHMPWCIKKCPYCDFNSHEVQSDFPESAYIDALIEDLTNDLQQFGVRPIHSIFIGGGTPSLFSGNSYHRLLSRIRTLLPTDASLEITLEANPGTIDEARFSGYLEAGITRLSLGVQSFDQTTLKHLGRIHDDQASRRAFQLATALGFQNINLDLMYGAPHQTVEQGLTDLQIALSLNPTHLSWYQFTLEPNTYFYRHPPPLPSEDLLCDLEEAGLLTLQQHGFTRYEISAFHRPHHPCAHNLNYWRFGDYYGIGAGAHGKLTNSDTGQIIRTQKHRIPKHYLQADRPYLTEQKTLTDAEKCFEFMLNALRLEEAIPFAWFTQTTHLPIESILSLLQVARQKGLLSLQEAAWQITPLGRRYTNDVVAMFLP